MAGTREIEKAIADLALALGDAGVEPPSRSTDHAVLGEIEAAIVPLHLPMAVRRFWELVDPPSLSVHPFPDLTSPGFALESWQNHERQAPGMVPRVLFPIGYESQCFLMVELDGPAAEDGGAIFAWGYGRCEFRLVFADLCDFVDYLSSCVRSGRCKRRAAQLLIDGDLLEEAPAPVVHPVFGALDTISEQILEWPESWLVRSGVGAERRQPLGADRTIAEILEAGRAGEVTGRVHATVTELAAGGGGVRVTVADETGSMRIWVPAAATALGPVIRRRFEFDVVAPPHGVPDPPDLSAMGADPNRGQVEHAMRAVDASATDVRPADL